MTLDNCRATAENRRMGMQPESGFDRLWQEYSAVFRDFDDLTLARWLAQTLGQFEGRVWRLSHPLVGSYRMAAQIGHDRQVWLRRLATAPHAYPESPCCHSPLLPLLSRDVREDGLLCEHCGETLVPFVEIPEVVREPLRLWAERYEPVHEVAHWDEARKKLCGNYDEAMEQAAKEAQHLLAEAGRDLAPQLLDFYPAILWEDHDECLEVPPEEIQLR
jgi:hypothetical protein